MSAVIILAMENNLDRLKSNGPWEELIGYNRCVRFGNLIEVAGTTATGSNGETVYVDDPYNQTLFILQKIDEYLKKIGSSIENTIRSRIYLTDINSWELVAKAHREVFSENQPVNTLIQISRLIRNDLLVEIEITATT